VNQAAFETTKARVKVDRTLGVPISNLSKVAFDAAPNALALLVRSMLARGLA